MANFLKIHFDNIAWVPFSITKAKILNINNCIEIHDLNCLGVKVLNNLNFNCYCVFLKSTDFVKHLGVTIDRFLKWNTHVELTIEKITDNNNFFV